MIIINLILVTWTRDNSKKDDAAILFLLLWRSWVYLPSQDTKVTVPVCTYPHSITAVSHTVGKENNPFGKLAEEGWEGLGTTKFLSHTWSERLSWQPKDIKRHSKSSECNNRLWNKLCSTYTAGLRTPEQHETEYSSFSSLFSRQSHPLVLLLCHNNLHTVLWTQGSVSITKTPADLQLNLNLIELCIPWNFCPHLTKSHRNLKRLLKFIYFP